MAKVKICGLSRIADIEAVNEAMPDYAGFVFFEKSKRNIAPDLADILLAALDPDIQSVAVCVSPDKELLETILELPFDILQIHGTIPQDALADGGLPLWQAVNISDGIKPELFQTSDCIKGYVIDGANYGGGQTFDWDANKDLAIQLKTQSSGKDLILAGGLNVDNVETGIRLFSPDIVDVSSGVETDGLKDKEKILAFVRKVREL